MRGWTRALDQPTTQGGRVAVKRKKLKDRKKEARKANRKARRKDSAWARGIPYSEFLSSPHWLDLRHGAITKYGLTCQICGSVADNSSEMNLHHFQGYGMKGRETLCNLAWICRDCHYNCHYESPLFGGDDAVMKIPLRRKYLERRYLDLVKAHKANKTHRYLDSQCQEAIARDN
jgi:hypothetical protein